MMNRIDGVVAKVIADEQAVRLIFTFLVIHRGNSTVEMYDRTYSPRLLHFKC